MLKNGGWNLPCNMKNLQKAESENCLSPLIYAQNVRAKLNAGVEALKGEDPPEGSMEAPTFRYIFFALLRL